MRRLAVPLLLASLAGWAWSREAWEPGAGAAPDVAWTALEARGRDVYRAELCWQCHARFVRPLDDELRRWGPLPAPPADGPVPLHLRGARRGAPDLAQPATPHSADWLRAHLFAPRALDPGAQMPAYPQLFQAPDAERAAEVEHLVELFDADGDRRVSFVADRREDWAGDEPRVARMRDLDVAGLRAPPPAARQSKTGAELWPAADGTRAYVDRWQPGEAQGDGLLSLRDVMPAPTEDGQALVAYLLRVGEGARSPAWEPPSSETPVAASDPQAAAALYARRCAGCHGEHGRGDGPAARFLDTPPTDLARGPFKYRSTPAGGTPTLDDLARTIRRGLPGGVMPGQPDLTPTQVEVLARHTADFAGGAADRRIAFGRVPLVLRARDDWDGYVRHVLRGKAVFVTLGCNTCHGTEGRGDGPDAVSEFSTGRRVRARDFRPRDARDEPRLRFRGGAEPQDVWRTVMNGLDPKGMPGAGAVFQGPEARVGEDGLLSVPLKDPRLFEVGVRPGTEDGQYCEILEKLSYGAQGFGDDWALVLYVLHLARTEDEVARHVMAWPWIEVAK